MAQREKVLAAKSDTLSSVLGANTEVDGKS